MDSQTEFMRCTANMAAQKPFSRTQHAKYDHSQISLGLTGPSEGGSLAQAGPLAAGRWWSVAGQVHIQKVLPLHQVKASQQTTKEREKKKKKIQTGTVQFHFMSVLISFI